MQNAIPYVLYILGIYIIFYCIIVLIYSYFRYIKFKYISNKLYEESRKKSNETGLNICQLTGCVCNKVIEYSFEEFLDFLHNQVNRYGEIHILQLSDDNESFLNILENHIFSKYCIVIRGTAIVPATYADYIRIALYLSSSTDKIIFHTYNNKKSDSSEEIYKEYNRSLIELKKMEEFNNVTDVIAINYSPEFKDKKIIWRNYDNNILYMHGYENDSISMLVAIMYHYYTNNKAELINKLNVILTKFKESTKLSLYTFIETDIEKIVDNVISNSNIDKINTDDMISVENTWIYNMYSSSIWNLHEYMKKVIDSIENDN
jgi:hypothetical protein